MKKKLAIIGSGISGLSSAYFLSQKYDVHLYEKNLNLGGHTRTIFINENKNSIPIDTGFIVFNEKNYPDLVNFFKILNIKEKDSTMSFAFSSLSSKVEYSGKNLLTLFANTRNLFSYKFLKMLNEIYRFYNICNKIELNNKLLNMTLGDFLNEYKFSNYLKNYHIYPMICSIWSSSQRDVKNFPLISFLHFFQNHGLFRLKNRPQWKYVYGGSNEYIKKLIKLNLFSFTTNFKIKYVERFENNIEVVDFDNNKMKFDKLIFATHADQALSLIKNPNKKEIDILSSFKYSQNDAYLHTDKRLMPENRSVWSSWNFIENRSNNKKFTLTYWMNLLQNLQTEKNYFVTINPDLKPSGILDKTTFEHPIFSNKMIEAQQKIPSIQGNLNTFFCGSYLGYGFHEDGIQSAAYVASLLKVKLPWVREKNFYNRLQI